MRFCLLFLFLIGILVYHYGRKANVLVTKIISKPAGKYCGNGYKEIRPPDMVELKHRSAHGNSENGEQTEIHTFKKEEEYLHNSAKI